MSAGAPESVVHLEGAARKVLKVIQWLHAQ